MPLTTNAYGVSSTVKSSMRAPSAALFALDCSISSDSSLSNLLGPNILCVSATLDISSSTPSFETALISKHSTPSSFNVSFNFFAFVLAWSLTSILFKATNRGLSNIVSSKSISSLTMASCACKQSSSEQSTTCSNNRVLSACLKNSKPRPKPSLAPSNKPGTSAKTIRV